jgi:hypothetical protein
VLGTARPLASASLASCGEFPLKCFDLFTELAILALEAGDAAAFGHEIGCECVQRAANPFPCAKVHQCCGKFARAAAATANRQAGLVSGRPPPPRRSEPHLLWVMLMLACAVTTTYMARRTLPWPIRSVLAGTAGTAALTLAYATERRIRSGRRGPLDYDDSLVPGQIVASVLHLPHVTGREEQDLGLLLRWSYGSVFGVLHGILRRRFSEPVASAIFGATLMSATLSLFPLLGRTPPPWRWPPDVMATSVGTHVAYVAAVATADDTIGRVQR